MKVHIDNSALEYCINPDSFGEICVHCNACGRIDKTTEKECKLELYKNLLMEAQNFNRWQKGWEEIQKKNIAENIKYLELEIKKLEEEI